MTSKARHRFSGVEPAQTLGSLAKLVITGTGFTDTVYVRVGNFFLASSPFATNGSTVTAFGKLTNGVSLKKALPRGRPTNVVVQNSDGSFDTFVFTRR